MSLETFANSRKPLLMINILCGSERHHWINPFLFNRLFSDGMREKRFVVTTGLTMNVRPFEVARNCAVIGAQRSGADWLCMIDNDVAPPENFIRALDGADARGADVVTITTYVPGKDGRPYSDSYVDPGAESKDFDTSHGLAEVAWTGMPCTFFRMSMFDKLPKPYFRTALLPFNDDPALKDAGTWVSEDSMFSVAARNAGFKIFASTKYVAEHFKTIGMTKTRRLMREGNYPEDEFLLGDALWAERSHDVFVNVQRKARDLELANEGQRHRAQRFSDR